MIAYPVIATISPNVLLLGPLGWSELMIILFLVLIFFGPRRLPEVAEAIGKSLQKFKKASREIKQEIDSQLPDAEEDTEKKG